jgi:hypothetical protein
LRARLPTRITVPSAITTSSASRFTAIEPYSTVVVPVARVEIMPPMEALAPGSIGKYRPVSRSQAVRSSRLMPGCTTQSRSSECTSSTRFMRDMSSEMPP